MKSNMRAVIKPHCGVGVKLDYVEIPIISPRDVLIKVKAAAICGSDIPIYDWDDPSVREMIKPGLIIGHEFCGIVVERGELVNGVAVGDFVTVEGHLNCGICNHCRRGEAHLCPNQKLLGFEHPGAFAEYVSVPASNVIHLSHLPLVLAAIQDPLGNAIHASMKVPLTNADVLVTGCGPIGLMSIALAKLSGARRIFATDPSQYRLALATKMGADFALNPDNFDIEELIREETIADAGVDILLEMSGNPEALLQGFRVLRNGGQAILMGLPKERILFDFANDIVAKGITVHGVVGREMYKTWDQVQKFLDPRHPSKIINLYSIITHRFLLEDFETAMDLMRSRKCGKVVLFMDEETLEQSYHEVPNLDSSF